MKNLEWCRYTYLHRRAFEYCVKRLIVDPGLREELLRRARIHDMDKMVMYLFLDQQTAQRLHVETQPHHLENHLPRCYEDYVETVIDYECAPYTKPDKPLNAWDFVRLLADMKALDTGTAERLKAIMRALGIDRSDTVQTDREGLEYIQGLGEVTEEMLYEEILRYVDENRDNALGMVLKYVKKDPNDWTGSAR